MNTLLNRFLFILLACLLLISCGKNSETVEMRNGVIDINVTEALKNVRDFNLSEIVKDVEFVTLESTPESFFNLPGRIQITDNYIFIFGMVSKNILLFDRSGIFIRRIGQTGKGPGEYISGTTASINPGEEYIIVVDGNGGKLLKYDLQGNFILQKNYRSDFPYRIVSDLIFLDDNNFAVATARPPVPIDNYHRVLVFDVELNLSEKLLPIPNNDSLCLKYLNPPLLSSGYSLDLYYEGFTDTLYSISPGEEPSPKYHFTIDKNRYTLDFMTWKDQSKKPKDFTFVLAAYDFPRYLLFRTHSFWDPYQMVYDKKKKVAFTTDDGNCCDTASYYDYESHNITNDLFGYQPIGLRHQSPNLNLLVYSLSLERAQEKTDLECFRKRKVRLPEKRDELADMIENFSGEELPLLVLMYLKES